MICVTIARTRHKMVLAEHRALAERGAMLVELRLDWLSRPPQLGRLIENRPTPVVITCRRPEDGGRWQHGEEARRTLLRQAIVSGADYVDLEADVAADIGRYGDTKRIISHHDFNETPQNLEDIHAQLCRLDPDIVKLVTMANQPEDNIRLLRIVSESEVPTIGFCMGEFGIPSRLLCVKYGSPFTYCTFSRDRVLAPGQLPFEEMRDVYRVDQIGPDTKVFGVVGDPISQSLSPLIHNAALSHLGIDAIYLPMRVPMGRLQPVLDAYGAIDVSGYSVTIPHKQDAAAYAQVQDASTQAIGAANTLYRNERDAWVAANTDYEAALTSLRNCMEGESLAGKRVMLLGAGGVARAIGLGVTRAGCVVAISNRNKERGLELAAELGCQWIAWENRASFDCDILINGTPVGMYPDMNVTPYEQNWLRDEIVVFDTIYNPENTLLLKQARERGCRTISGLEMFVLQGAEQFRCFTGQPAPLDVMTESLRKGISAARS